MKFQILLLGCLALAKFSNSQLTKEWIAENIQSDKIPEYGKGDECFTLRVKLDESVILGCGNDTEDDRADAVACLGNVRLVNQAWSSRVQAVDWSMIETEIDVQGLTDPTRNIYGGLLPNNTFTSTICYNGMPPLDQTMRFRIHLHRSSTKPWTITFRQVGPAYDLPIFQQQSWTSNNSTEFTFRIPTYTTHVSNYSLMITDDSGNTIFSKAFECFLTTAVTIASPEMYYSYTGLWPVENVTSEYLDRIFSNVKHVRSDEYFRVNKTYIFDCPFRGYPFSWERTAIYWKPRDCRQAPCKRTVILPGIDDPNGLKILSVAQGLFIHRYWLMFTAKESGYYSCSYERNGELQTWSRSPKELVVVDSPDGSPVYAERFEPYNGSIYTNDRVILRATINRFHYESPVWNTSMNGAAIVHPYNQGGLRTNLFVKGNSLIFDLIIENATLADSNQYRCIARKIGDRSIFESKIIPIVVKPEEPPSFGNGTSPVGHAVRALHSEVALYCDAKGAPEPRITWIKDGRPIDCEDGKCGIKFLDDGKRLVIHSLEPTNAGKFGCQLRNRLDTKEYPFKVSIDNSNTHQAVALGVSLAFVGLLAAVAAGFAIKYWRSSRHKKAFLADIEELEVFLQEIFPETDFCSLDAQRTSDTVIGQENGDQEIRLKVGVGPLAHAYTSDLAVENRRFYKGMIPEERLVLGGLQGAGAFGKVYRSYMASGGLKVAEKHLIDTRYKKDFEKEIRLMQVLPYHVNVITLLGVVTRGGMFCAVMEFCEYGSLHDFILRSASSSSTSGRTDSSSASERQLSDDYVRVREPSPPKSSPYSRPNDAPDSHYVIVQGITDIDKLYFCYQIACGMEHLSQNKIQHGDVAARNMLLNKYFIVKVADFGLAQSDDESVEKKGTFPWKWVAPETLKSGHVLKKSDVWSLGVTMHEIYNGCQEPYKDIKSKSQLLSQLQVGIRLPKPKGCPKELYQLLCECWNLKESSRPDFSRCREEIVEIAQKAHGEDWTSAMERLDRTSVQSKERVNDIKERIREWNDQRSGKTTENAEAQGANNVRVDEAVLICEGDNHL